MTCKLVCRATPERANLIVSVLTEAADGDCAVSTLEEPDGLWRVEAYFDLEPDVAALEAFAVEAIGGPAGFELETVPEMDWVAEVQRGLPPVRAGRFLIHGSHDRAAAKGKRFAIEIDAGQAFGTAHHGTTQGCLTAISDLALKGRAANVLDLGTGSGVLAIAAARVFHAPAIAGDIDPVAVRVARENCRINGAAPWVRTIRATGVLHPLILERRPFDLVVANILAGPLLKLAPSIRGVLAPRGALILSGLLDYQAAEVLGRYRGMGFVCVRRYSIGGWATLVLQSGASR